MSTGAPELSAVLDRIRGWATANGLKPATLARQADLNEVVTRDMSEAGWSPTSRSIRRLEALIPEGWKVGDPLPAETSARADAPGASAAETAS